MTIDTKAVRAPDCKWIQEADDDGWHTQCGGYATVIADLPSDNLMHFCWYCGGKLIEVPIEPYKEDEE